MMDNEKAMAREDSGLTALEFLEASDRVFEPRDRLRASEKLRGFAAAENCHKNFYRDEMEDFEVKNDRPIVHLFVNRILALTNGAQ